MISYEEFSRLELVTGVIVTVEDHPDADRLQILRVDIGEEKPRTLVAGLKGHYEASDLVGMRVVVVANLAPVKLRGVESRGMILAAQDGDTVSALTSDKPVSPGSKVR